MQSSCTHTVYIRQLIQSIWLLMQLPLNTGQVTSNVCQHYSLFLTKVLLCFFVFTGCFGFNSFLFLFRLNLLFVNFIYLLLVLLQFSLSRRTSNVSRYFLTSIVRLTNSRTFKQKQLATLLYIFCSPKVLTTNSF